MTIEDNSYIKGIVEFYRSHGDWNIIIKAPRWLLDELDSELHPGDGNWHALFVTSGPVIGEKFQQYTHMIFRPGAVKGERISSEDDGGR